MARADFTLNPAGIQQFFRSPGGEVGRDLARRMIRVESQAKVNASGRPGPNVQTGRLRSSIRWDMATDDQGLYGIIGAYTPYARFVELGTDRAPAYPYLKPALKAAE